MLSNLLKHDVTIPDANENNSDSDTDDGLNDSSTDSE